MGKTGVSELGGSYPELGEQDWRLGHVRGVHVALGLLLQLPPLAITSCQWGPPTLSHLLEVSADRSGR